MTKSAHFLLVRTNFSVKNYAKLYLAEIVKLHGALISIISDHGPLFSSHFSKSFQRGLSIRVCLITSFHPQMDGQVERTI